MMNVCNYNPYSLPAIDFVGGETQDLAFHVYFYIGKKPYDLRDCVCEFAIVNFMNKTGEPILTKPMDVAYDSALANYNVLKVTLQPEETIDLFGKYIYQIIIQDRDGDVEIPKQGCLYITNNINKAFFR